VAKRSGDVVLATESGGQVYVQDFDALSAYPADCRSDGGVCPPIWTYHIASGFTQAIMPVAEGDLVFTAARDGLVLAFPTDCSDPCKPIWTGTAGMGTLGGIAVSGGKVYASSDEGLVVFGLPNHS
jgi:outer membrane protein assembly factor BamB